jgi:hypothetical protein
MVHTTMFGASGSRFAVKSRLCQHGCRLCGRLYAGELIYRLGDATVRFPVRLPRRKDHRIAGAKHRTGVPANHYAFAKNELDRLLPHIISSDPPGDLGLIVFFPAHGAD